MCESGAWKNFDEMEDTLTLDELFILYETASERQQRLMKTVAAAMGANVSDEERHEYQGGEIAAGESTLFGYQQAKAGDVEG
jgi:hypothetical protein